MTLGTAAQGVAAEEAMGKNARGPYRTLRATQLANWGGQDCA